MAAIIRDLTFIARCGMQYRTQQLEDTGLTARQASSLFVICRDPGISQDRLARRIVLSKSNITRQLVNLEEAGYVQRRPSPTDKRVMMLYPTEKAIAVYPRIRQVYGDWRGYLLADLSEEEQEQLESLLLRIKSKAELWLEENRNE